MTAAQSNKIIRRLEAKLRRIEKLSRPFAGSFSLPAYGKLQSVIRRVWLTASLKP